MKSALSLMLVVSLVVSALPATAQEQTKTLRASQASPLRTHSDSFWYGRFGYESIFGDQTYGGLAFGFGRRVERKSVGIDVSLFNLQFPLFQSTPSNLYYGASNYTYALAGSLLTLKGLYFMTPGAHTTGYFGGGVGWGGARFGSGGDDYKDWHGSGLEGKLTVGYELARATTSTRLFVQADAARPFYKMTSESVSRSGVVIAHRYAPSLVVSIGVGW